MNNCIDCVFKHLYRSNDIICPLCESDEKTNNALITFIDNDEHLPMIGGFGSVQDAKVEMSRFQPTNHDYHVVAWNEDNKAYLLLE